MLDPRTGEVLAMASTPTYDASAMANPTTAAATFAALRDDPDQPLLPRATQGRYVPGLGLQDRHRRSPALGSARSRRRTTYAEQPAAEKTGLLVDGFRIRDGHHPQTGDTGAGPRARRSRSPATSGSR